MTTITFPPNDFIQQHILCGATMLIYNLHQEGKLDEEYWDLLYSIDWDTALDELESDGGSIKFRDGKYHYCKNEVSYYDAPTKFDLIRAYYNHDMSEFEKEVLEWWICSDWLYNKLKAKGETIDTFYGLQIWGRTCSGQAIKCDWVIQTIYKDFISK